MGDREISSGYKDQINELTVLIENAVDVDQNILDTINTLATQIQDDTALDDNTKKRFQTKLDKLEMQAIIKQIKTEDKAILRLFQKAQPMTHENLTPEDKRSLQQLILLFAPDILNEELDLMYPPGEPESNSKKAVKLAELLSIYMNLLERLLPTFFGAHPTVRTRLFIPDTQAPEGALMVDLAMRAVYQYMVQIKTIGQSASAIADVVVPRTAEDIAKMLITFGLTIVTLEAISPRLFMLIKTLTTGAGLTVSDIRLIMTQAFMNAGYISAFLLWCHQNSEQMTELAWKIFSKTLGRGMPEAPQVPVPGDFKTLFDNLSKSNIDAHRRSLIGDRPNFNYDLSTGLDCIVYLTRVACVAQADMMAAAVRQVPRALKYLSNTCSRLAQRGAQALSSSAVQFESRADAVSPDTYNSFSDLLSQLAGNVKYATLHANDDFRRCMELMQLNNPNPHSLNAARVQASVAQHRQQFGEPVLDRRRLAESERATQGESSQDLTLTPDYVSADQMRYDLNAAGGLGASTGDMLPPNDATYASETPEGLKPSDEARDLLDVKYKAAESTVPTDSGDEGDNMGNVGLGASGPASGLGGRSRSRKRSVSKRTRRKGVAKKQKSKKNKRQSRRKVRRASSRKSRK